MTDKEELKTFHCSWTSVIFNLGYLTGHIIMPMRSLVLLVNLIFLICLIAETGASTHYRNVDAGLTSVPTNIPTTTKKVTLNKNALTSITSMDFALLTQLDLLELNTNNINSIALDAFEKTNMRYLDLSSNPIKIVLYFAGIDSSLKYLRMMHCQISNATWDNVVHYSNLLTLALDNNQITSVPNVTKSTRRLQKLTLNSNNIEVLEVEKLEGCIRMNWLSCDSNGMKFVDGILKLPELTNLYLQFNLLSQFPDISYMQKLRNLFVTDNKIQNIPNNSFINNQQLVSFYIETNNLNLMPNLEGAKTSLELFWVNYNTNITYVPNNYFNGFTVLRHVSMIGTSITSLSYLRSVGPSVQILDLRSNKITNEVPAGTFLNATGMKDINLSHNRITGFDMRNIENMPGLAFLRLSGNRLTVIENAYIHCRDAACASLQIDIDLNPIPCDRNLCWAKLNATIELRRDQCSGKNWNDVSLDDLSCSTGEPVMKLTEKQGYNSMFQKQYELLHLMHDYKRSKLGQQDLMQCIGACLATDDCHYFKHGNTTNDFSFSKIKDCVIWRYEPRK